MKFEDPSTIAAVFIEPIVGTNGIIIPPPPKGYLKGLRDLTNKYGILLACDLERSSLVMSGFGRTEKWFAVDHWDIVPDIITMAKGLTGSYIPGSAVAIAPHIATYFQEKSFMGGLTYQAHPMCLSAAIATIKVMKGECIVENSERMGKILKEIHKKMMRRHICIGDIRSIGLFGCLELVKDRKTKEPMSAEVMAKVDNYLKINHIYCMFSSHLLHTNPPLIITETQLRTTFDIIDKALYIADEHCNHE